MTAQPAPPTYVVGVDAAAADAALLVHRAASLARQTGAQLSLVLAYQPARPTPRAYDLDPVPPVRSSLVAHELLDALVASLDEADRALVAETDVVLGHAGPSLVERADDAELLVVGSRGRHGLVRGALTGSVADYCVRHARCSVLVVRPHHHATDGTSPVSEDAVGAC